jgi:8-oxo-dGTP pyrophosphatase MutT (NUDIX family)
MSYLDRVKACHGFRAEHFRRFIVAGAPVGWVLPSFADALGAHRDVFSIDEDAVRLSDRLVDFDARTKAVQEVLEELVRAKVLRKLRREPYPVGTGWGQEPLLIVDRAVVPLFGIEAYGIHVNGIVRARDGLKLWVGRRAKDKATAPGKLDHLIAGGHPHGISLADNLAKEAKEEANIPKALARTAVPVGAVSYRLRNEEGLRNDLLFIYDLDVPEDFTPENTDGEVEEFFLWPVEKVMQVLRDTDEFKFNVALVIVDFLIRHGYIRPDDCDYEALVHGRVRGWGGGNDRKEHG